MARGRPWTKEEDRELRRIASRNQSESLLRRNPFLADVPPPVHTSYLRAFAERQERSYAAVRQRASRLGIRNTLEPKPAHPIVTGGTGGNALGGFLPGRKELKAFVQAHSRP